MKYDKLLNVYFTNEGPWRRERHEKHVLFGLVKWVTLVLETSKKKTKLS